MKHISPFLITLFALCIGVANVWAAETLTINGNASGNNAPWGTSYRDGSGTSVTSSGTSVGITYTQTACMSSTIQIKKGTSSGFYSTSVPANSVITSIAITSKTNSVSLYVSKDGSNWGTATSISSTTTKTYTTADGYLYFKVNATSKYAQITSIVVTYESAGSGSSCTKPTFTIEDKTISLAEASAANYDLSALTTNKGGSTGSITYTCDDGSVVIDGTTFYTETPGTYTITATMAVDETYCEATTTFTITVQSVPCTQLAAPTGLNASATAYDAATLTWTAVENATKYQITTTPPIFGSSATYETTETTYEAKNLNAKTTYKWTVKAIGNGSTYCDSEKSAENTFITSAKPTYTITWSTPSGTSTTPVTQGDKVVLPTTNPEAPKGCHDKVFMGWSTANIGTTGTNNAPDFITAETVPSGNVTYYAVFATETQSSTGGNATITYGWESTEPYADQFEQNFVNTNSTITANEGSKYGANGTNKAGNTCYILTKTKYAVTSVKFKYSKTTNNTTNQTWVLQTSDDGATWTNNSTTFSASGATKGTWSEASWTLDGKEVYVKITMGTNSIAIRTIDALSITYNGIASTTYTDYVTNCVECTSPATPLALSVAETTLNLGENGTATTTFSTTGGNGGTIDYAVNPTAGATLDKDNKTITFNAAGTYTLTASQDLNTTNGTTYCGSRVSQTITITKNPVWDLTSNLVPFATTCTETSAVQEMHLSGYNLSDDIKATLHSNSAFSLSANQTDWSKSITLPIENGKVDATIYVRLDKSESCPAAATNQKQGTVTISSTGITALTQPISGTISAPAVKVYLNDQEVATQITGQRLCCQIEEQTLKDNLAQVNCEDPHFSHFVTDPTKLETPVVFPYDITTTDDITFYAVYCKETETGAHKFEKVSSIDDIEGGANYVIAAPSTNEALSSTETETQYKYEALNVAIENDVITNPDASVVWQLKGSMSSGFSLYSVATSQYLSIIVNNSRSCLTMEDDAHLFTISGSADNVKIASKSISSYNYVSLYQSAFNAFSQSSTALSLYKRITNCTYVLKPCGPYIKATGDIAITSGKGIWVESVTPLTISAQNLDKIEDKDKDGNTVAVTITATVTDEAAAKGFSIKTQGTQGAGSAKTPVELAKNYTDATYDGALTVVYTPTEYDVTAEGKIALRVYKSGGSTTYATDTIVVRGRSLPAEFVIAAETKNGWVALPSDLAVGSTGALKYPYAISVDNDAAPTKATEAPETAIWLADARSTANAAATAIRLKNAQGKHLQGSTAKDETNVWLSDQNSEQAQSWELRSADFEHYFVRMQASEADRYLSYDATQGKIGNYKQMASLRILPVEKTCVRFDAPKLNEHKITSNAVTLQWEAIAGVADYEYSLDDGATWQTCTGVQTMGTAIQWTLGDLKAETPYTISVRAKAADGKTNCSDAKEVTATTTGCDDVPTDLWSSTTANSVTIMWNATAATATIKIYSDEKGKNEVQSVLDMTSPSKITGLEANTHYYYQVFANGTCGSAIENFWTESNEVSIVEWEKEAVIVDINTDVSDADDVSILVENQTTHGSNNKNVADDLFFSKYYEATGTVKLLAIYNGTKDTLSLSNISIKIGVSSWSSTQFSPTTYLRTFGRKKVGYIAPDEEIIIWTKGTSYNYSANGGANIIECVSQQMDVSIMEETETMIFGGKASIGLFRGDEMIDIIGAVDENQNPMQGTCKSAGTWRDDDGWCGKGLSIMDPTQEIELSTNRCLLVRSNNVKSGKNAVTQNVGDFNTLTSQEWLGRQVDKNNDNGDNYKGSKSSCEGFAYVADFNYNDYYTTYDSVGKLEIKGNRNPDGTYTIPVNRLDTMACTNLRLQLKKNGTLIASKEYKVPIVVDQSIDTKNATYFGGNKLTDEICATCDVVVRDKAQLTHTAGGKQQFRDMYIYAGSRLSIPAEQKMTLDKVRMFAQNDSVSYAVINNGDASDATITVKEVSHVKRIDGKYWYPFSLPYDCNIADIDQLSGQTLGVYGEDWGIKYYDGQRRQSDGNSTTHYGEVSKYWTMMPEDGVLKAYTGYIIGLFVPAVDEALMKSVNFPPANTSAYTESADAKTTPITNWPDNLTAQPRHHGWNFVGSPYISLFGVAEGEGLYNDQLTMGWTDKRGEQRDKEHIYVSIPNGGNSNTYTQAQASGVILKPFTAYFVQAIDPTNGQSNTLDLTYSKSNRRLLAPARAQEATPLILAELDIRCGALHDNAGVLVSDTYSADYEIGDDLYKMYAAEGKPQLYTTDARNDKMAYQALPDLLTHAVPLGIYVPAAGDYTLSLNRSLSRLTMADAVYLLHNGSVVADLLRADYTLSATARGTLGGYTLDIRRVPKMPTSLDPTHGDTPYLILRDGMLTIANLPAGATIQVYDVLGRLLLRTTATEPSLSVPAVQTGVYTVLITTDQQQTVLKTLCR